MSLDELNREKIIELQARIKELEKEAAKHKEAIFGLLYLSSRWSDNVQHSLDDLEGFRNEIQASMCGNKGERRGE